MAYYAVHVGRATGVFNSWAECERAVSQYKGATFKKFNTLQQAQDFVDYGPAGRAVRHPPAYHDTAAPPPPPLPLLEPVATSRPPPPYYASNAPAAAPTAPASSTDYKPSRGHGQPIHATSTRPSHATSGYPAHASSSRPVLATSSHPAHAASPTGLSWSHRVDPQVRAFFRQPTAAAVPGSAGQRHASSPAGAHKAPRVVYTDGCAFSNGSRHARGGIGVYWGPNDPRNVSEPLAGELQTNQRAELGAALRALEDTRNIDDPVEIRTDSQYTIKAVTTWLPGWKMNKFKTSTGSDVKNLDLILAVDKALTQRRSPVIWKHVSGHSGIDGNEQADLLAKQGAERHGRKA